ncbi:MAG TPA: hypothetical protein VHC67_07460 [Gaiellaceae bacterium]|jgi:hypothetical protein|nr:hypothetical protein [Gaiellaceae bacterium]
MRVGAALALVVICCAGCGGARHAAVTTTVEAKRALAPAGLRVGVVGPLRLDVPGVVVRRGRLPELAGLPLVVASARVVDPARVADAARSNPDTHYALIGASTKGDRVPNLVGVVLRDDEAARLGGIVAGLVASGNGGATPRVAWIGPQEQKLAAAFGQGVHRADSSVVVLRQWSKRIPARCEEAALTAIERGAVIVMAHGGLCADAAAQGAHQQNLPALRLADFELPSVAADVIVRDAVAGVYQGNEDIVFGATSGAIAIGPLDPRISLGTVVRARAVAGAG